MYVVPQGRESFLIVSFKCTLNFLIVSYMCTFSFDNSVYVLTYVTHDVCEQL